MTLKWAILHYEYFYFWCFKYILMLILLLLIKQDFECTCNRVILHCSVATFTQVKYLISYFSKAH